MTVSDSNMMEQARRFLEAAWQVLLEDRVVPRPRFSPYISVGHDYYGGELMALPEFDALESAITGEHVRFQEGTPLGKRDFANGYIFSLLEAFVASMSRADEEFSSDSESANEAIASLARAVGESNREVGCCRFVSHMTTLDAESKDILGVQIVPQLAEPSRSRDEEIRTLEKVLPRAAEIHHRHGLSAYAPPESILIARGFGEEPYKEAEPLSERINRILLVARLLQAGTCDSVYELQGETATVRRFDPHLVRFRGSGARMGSATGLLRRTVRIGDGDVSRFEGLSGMIDSLLKPEPNSIISSFAMAVHKFEISYHAHVWYEQLVDLATAFEATLSGTATSDVTLRLRSRAAALLWADNDSASAIFDDVGHLYNLRSKLVHGGSLTEKSLRKTTYAISTVPADDGFGVAIAQVNDRLRDLVRRSLLVRISLAYGDEPKWPLGDDAGVDSQLADDSVRNEWRLTSRSILASIDAESALDRPRAAKWSVEDGDPSH